MFTIYLGNIGYANYYLQRTLDFFGNYYLHRNFFCRQTRLPPAPTPAESQEEIRVRELCELEKARRQEDERILGEVSIVIEHSVLPMCCQRVADVLLIVAQVSVVMERLILALEEIRVRELRELEEVSVVMERLLLSVEASCFWFAVSCDEVYQRQVGLFCSLLGLFCFCIRPLLTLVHGAGCSADSH